MKNILYIGGFNLPDKNAAAQRVISNAKIFRDLGYSVKLYGLGTPTGCFQYEGFECQNLKYPRQPLEWYQYLATCKKYYSFIEEIKPSYIIAYNHPAQALELMLRTCRKNNIKLIADCTEWYTPEGNPVFKMIKGWDTRKRMEKVQPKLDGVISISRYLHDYYQAKGTKSILMPPLVDIENPKWKNHPVNTERNFIKLVYAGSPGHKDRLDTIVRAISENKRRKVIFTIIGIDEQKFRQLYGFQAPIPQGVSFKGRLPHKEVLTELLSADFQIFVREDNLTTKAGFPTKFVESITAGLPVLTNLTSNLGDYLSDGHNGFVLDTISETALLSSLDKVFCLSDEEIQLVKQSIDRETFDYRRYVSQMKEFIELI